MIPESRTGRGMVFFDLDHTLLDGDSYRMMLTELFRQAGLCGRIQFAIIAAFRVARLITHTRFKELSLRPFRGWDKESLAKWGEDFFYVKLANRLREQGRAAIQMHQEAGRQLVLASGAPEIYLSPAASYLGIRQVLGTPLEFQREKFTGRLAGADCLGKGKQAYAVRLAQSGQVEAAEAWFYTDHISDMPLLEWVGHPVVVNPDRKLRAMAEQRGWPILQW